MAFPQVRNCSLIQRCCTGAKKPAFKVGFFLRTPSRSKGLWFQACEGESQCFGDYLLKSVINISAVRTYSTWHGHLSKKGCLDTGGLDISPLGCLRVISSKRTRDGTMRDTTISISCGPLPKKGAEL